MEHGFPHSLLPSSPEPSPYEESEVHDSFHQLIQEQSLRVAEEGLELMSLAPGKRLTCPSGLHSDVVCRWVVQAPRGWGG